jgi:hypothetical protein
MRELNFDTWLLNAAVGGLLLCGSTGCEQLPGSPGAQGAVIGGAGGAAAGAAIGGHENRVLGALLGGALGAGGGYLIGANKDKITGHSHDEAERAVRNAQASPATPEQALAAPTADLNNDGFVTMDEVVAMKRAGMMDEQMLARMRATGHVFELTPQQQDFLRNNGISPYVIAQISDMNRNQIPAPTGYPSGVLNAPNPSYPPPNPSYPPPPPPQY